MFPLRPSIPPVIQKKSTAKATQAIRHSDSKPRVLTSSPPGGRHLSKLPRAVLRAPGWVPWRENDGVYTISSPSQEQVSGFREIGCPCPRRIEPVSLGSRQAKSPSSLKVLVPLQAQRRWSSAPRAQRGTVEAPAHRGTSVPPPRPLGQGLLNEPPLPCAHARWRVRRVRSGVFVPAPASTAHAPPPVPHPQPAAAWLSTCGTARGAVCASCSRVGGGVPGSSHGYGASERAVRGASESGDGHDGPQLHPALPAGSPQGSWGPGALGLPRDPHPRLPRRPFQAHFVSRLCGHWISHSQLVQWLLGARPASPLLVWVFSSLARLSLTAAHSPATSQWPFCPLLTSSHSWPHHGFPPQQAALVLTPGKPHIAWRSRSARANSVPNATLIALPTHSRLVVISDPRVSLFLTFFYMTFFRVLGISGWFVNTPPLFIGVRYSSAIFAQRWALPLALHFHKGTLVSWK